jgi:TonB-linked SusC/RagA family outer membrane protein
VSSMRVRFLFSLLGSLALPTAAVSQATTGTIRGTVTEAEGTAPVASAQIVIVGTRLGTLTRPSGTYSITGVPTGTQTVRVVRIGYSPFERTVTVTAGAETTLDVQLQRAAARLAEVVTTATGDQERRSFGNVVATVNADSVVGAAPVTTVHELLQARTAGVQVIQSTGQTGASSSIRIRGTSSLSLTNEPLVIIDGIRYDNSPASSNFTTARVNRMGTLNAEEIESMDIIKGPSAAALYGTAAANGVVVVKTKRGQAGAARYSAYVEGGRVEQPADWEQNYWSWGRNLNAQGQPTGNPIQCRVFQAAARACVIDSLTTYNPWTAPETDPFDTQGRFMAGLQASGGNDRFRYFLSGEHERETGPYEMPEFEINRITAERGSKPRGIEINPNQLQNNSIRGNFSVGVRPNLNVDVSTGYVRRDLYTAFEGTFFAGMTFQYLTAAGFKTTTNGLQREFVGDIFGIENKLRDDRFTSSGSATWEPFTWLQGRAVVGLDQDNSFGYRQQRRGEGTKVGQSWGPTGQEGGKSFDRSNSSRYTVDLGATATWAASPTISTRTSIGGQWFFDALYQSQGQGFGLPPGATSPNSAANQVRSFEFTTEERTYGAFLEEQVGWRDLLFATAGFRVDQTSAFGRNAGNTFYPRASLSYVISEEGWFPRVRGLDRLRLRAAYGKAGVQPNTIAALQFLGAAAFPAGASADEPGLRLSSIGNQRLKPEVTTEIEGGFDFGLLNERVTVELTAFRKISEDALFQRPLPPSFGTSIGAAFPTQWENLAKVENKGLELTTDVTVVRTNPVTWSVRLNGSLLKNKLVDAGNVPLPTTPGARNEVGYPLFGLWDRQITGWSDANNDGVITDAELTVTDNIQYKGSTLPTREAGFGTTIGLFNNSLQLNALFDYRGGFYKYWQLEQWRCVSSSNCRAVNDPSATQEDQVAAVAANSSTKRTLWGYFVPNDFVKFRELSLAYTVPERLTARFAGSRATTIVLSGRNLGYIMNKYPGIDPESNNAAQNAGGGNTELTAQPPIRYWIARVNVAF